MNLQNLCDSIDNTKKLEMLDNCFVIKQSDTVLAELCCLSNISLPMGGFERVSSPVAASGTMTLFDNNLDISPVSGEAQVRGVIMCVTYPSLDANGEEIESKDKNVILHLYDKDNNHFELPIAKSFVSLGNPVTDDSSKVINRIVVENPGNFTPTVEALLLTTDSDGLSLTQTEGSCC